MEKCNGGTLEAFIQGYKRKGLILESTHEEFANSPENSPVLRQKQTLMDEALAASIVKDICNGLS